ncbi:MAG: hypothetical protein IKK39_09295 [Thermoguttaceae bacterium]|nr:hypothetical protein [Thermoguttaceae bacterium]
MAAAFETGDLTLAKDPAQAVEYRKRAAEAVERKKNAAATKNRDALERLARSCPREYDFETSPWARWLVRADEEDGV